MKKIKKIQVKKVKDILVPKDYSLQKVGITQSLMQAFKTCPRSFLFKLNRYYHEDEYKTMLFGNIIHFLVENIMKNPSQKIESLLYQFRVENPDIIDKEFLQHQLNIANVIIKKYIEHYPEDFNKSKSFLCLEKEDSVYINEYKINYKVDGKFDQKNEIWNMEHKTKGRIIEESFMKMLSFDFQDLLYLICEEKACKQEIKGTLQNIIRNPQLRLKKNESDEDFMKRIEQNIKERPDFYFMRFEIPFTIKTKVDFINELKYTLKDIKEKISTCKKTGKNDCFYKKNPGACQGMYTCRFLDACSSGLMTGYKQKEKLFVELNTINY